MLCVLQKSELNIAAELYAKAYNVNITAALEIVNSFAFSVFAQKDNNNISAILCGSKISIAANNAVLLHGAAFASTARPNEMQQLVCFAKESLQADNYFVTMLDELSQQGQKHDMINIVQARLLTREIKRNLWAKADFDTITAKKLIALREKYIKEKSIKLEIEQASALVTCLYSQGISSAETDKAYALYFRTKDSLAVAEIYAEDDTSAGLLLEAMADREGRNTAQLTLSENNTIFAGEGKRFDYARYSGCEIEKNNLYIGPMPK